MGLSKTLLLGFIAGVTILLGLPVGRMRGPAPSLRREVAGSARPERTPDDRYR